MPNGWKHFGSIFSIDLGFTGKFKPIVAFIPSSLDDISMFVSFDNWNSTKENVERKIGEERKRNN